MHIALVSEHANPLNDPSRIGTGEQCTHVAALASSLVGLGHRVDVFTRRDDVTRRDELIADGGYTVHHVDAGPPKPVPAGSVMQYANEFGSALVDRWCRERPDVVHAHHWTSGLLAVLAAREVDIPTVVTFHTLASMERGHGKGAHTEPDDRVHLERHIARSATAIVATSSDEMGALTRLGVPRSKIRVLPDGVDLERFNPDGPVAERGAQPRRIVCSGTLEPHRGLERVVKALVKVVDAELVIEGAAPADSVDDSGGEARRLLGIAEKLGVADRVVLAGGVPYCDMPALLRSADLYVHTPDFEFSGTPALQAMACGTAVVATDVGGPSDTIVDGITGRLVDPRDRRALVRAIDELLGNQPRRFALGVAGADRAQSRFAWDRIAEDTGRLYRDARALVPSKAPLVDSRAS